MLQKAPFFITPKLVMPSIYAKGKIYTGHENEVVGDHVQNNLDGITNFGVMNY